MDHPIKEIKTLLSTTLNVEPQLLDTYQTEEDTLFWFRQYIDHLISKDFDALLLLLYRIDVNEEKVRSMLAATKGENPAQTIAELILERQKQKLYWRNKFRNSPVQIDDEERW